MRRSGRHAAGDDYITTIHFASFIAVQFLRVFIQKIHDHKYSLVISFASIEEKGSQVHIMKYF